jgi:phosphate transport system substrate-binding protein
MVSSLKNTPRILFALFLGILDGGVQAETILIGGTGSALETMRKLGMAYTKNTPKVQVDVLPSLGSGGAIKGLVTRSVDLGVSSRPLKEEEKAQGLQSVLVAQTPVVITTSVPNHFNFTTVQLEDFYSGKIASWQNKLPVRLVLRPISETDTQLLGTLSAKLKESAEAALKKEGMINAITDQDAANALESVPGSIGLTTLALIRSENRPLKALSINGVDPEIKGKVNPEYQLIKPLYVVIRVDAKPETKKFFEFLLSKQGQTIFLNNGYAKTSP